MGARHDVTFIPPRGTINLRLTPARMPVDISKRNGISRDLAIKIRRAAPHRAARIMRAVLRNRLLRKSAVSALART